MSPDAVRLVAAALVVVLTTGCGTSLEDRRPDESLVRSQALRESRVVFLPGKPRAQSGPRVSEAELQDAVQGILPEVWMDGLRAEWRRIVSDARFHRLRAQNRQRPTRLMLASWSSRDSALEEITKGYQQWCSLDSRRGNCIPLLLDRTSLNDSEVYQVAFDFAMGASWSGFT